MATPGQSIDNPVTGQRIVWHKTARDTGGLGWEIEWITQPFRGDAFPPPHVHPLGRERFEILAGTARYQVGREIGTATVGDSIAMPAAVPHRHPWSISPEELRFRHSMAVDVPDMAHMLAHEVFFETIFALAREGKVNRASVPNLLHFAVVASPTMPLTLLPVIPASLQVPLLAALAALGRRLGYTARV